jgi:hypothetical protein
MRFGILSKVLLDPALIFPGWTLGNFCISLIERRDRRIILVVLLPPGLLGPHSAGLEKV